jgi:hypothetical protein
MQRLSNYKEGTERDPQAALWQLIHTSVAAAATVEFAVLLVVRFVGLSEGDLGGSQAHSTGV